MRLPMMGVSSLAALISMSAEGSSGELKLLGHELKLLVLYGLFACWCKNCRLSCISHERAVQPGIWASDFVLGYSSRNIDADVGRVPWRAVDFDYSLLLLAGIYLPRMKNHHQTDDERVCKCYSCIM